jgi:hypothetical protein
MDFAVFKRGVARESFQTLNKACQFAGARSKPVDMYVV